MIVSSQRKMEKKQDTHGSRPKSNVQHNSAEHCNGDFLTETQSHPACLHPSTLISSLTPFAQPHGAPQSAAGITHAEVPLSCSKAPRFRFCSWRTGGKLGSSHSLSCSVFCPTVGLLLTLQEMKYSLLQHHAPQSHPPRAALAVSPH